MASEVQGPFCCACGVHIPEFDVELFPEPEDIEKYGPLPEERKDTARRRFWTSLHRVLIRSKKTPKYESQCYHLSGIGRFQLPFYSWRGLKHWTPERVFGVPWERDKVITDESHITGRLGGIRERRIPVYAANLWDDRNQDIYPHGFPVHAYCWGVIERIIGSVAEEELDLLVQTLLERWKKRPFEVNRCVRNRTWVGTKFESGELLPQCLIATADPGDIPEIKDILHRAAKKTAQKKESRSLSRSSHFVLPLDIQLLILDRLRSRDARNAAEVLGWEAPSSYWRHRCSPCVKYVHEFEEVKSLDLDWKSIYQELEEMIEKKVSHGFKNRLRIFRILEETSNLFLRRLAQRDGFEN